MDVNSAIVCDRCSTAFDEENHMPTILPDCGHTVCSTCVQELITLEDDSPDRVCNQCDTIIHEHVTEEDFRINFKLLSAMQALRSQPHESMHTSKHLTQTLAHAVSCNLHPGHPIAYFCRSCNQAVCVDCMFDSHNGHLLVSIDDMGKSKLGLKA